MNGTHFRPMTLDDSPRLADMLNARDLDLFGTVNQWENTIRGNLEAKGFNLEDSSVVAVAPDGSIAGFEVVYDFVHPLRANLWGHLDSRYRGQGIASHMLEWAIDRASRNIATAPANAKVSLSASVYVQDEYGKRLMADHGFEHVRTFYTMRRDFAGSPELIPLPDGFNVVSFAECPDLRRFVQVDIDSFRDHWGYVAPELDEEIARWQEQIDTAPDFDPNCWWLATYGDEPAGLILTATECTFGKDIAWVSSLGVRRQFRKKGLASALLSRAFTTYFARGKAGIALGVDASSLTNAVALYERAGMRVIQQRNVYDKVLRDGEDVAGH